MWDLMRPGIEPTSRALEGGFLITGPPGKSPLSFKQPFSDVWRNACAGAHLLNLGISKLLLECGHPSRLHQSDTPSEICLILCKCRRQKGSPALVATAPGAVSEGLKSGILGED